MRVWPGLRRAGGRGKKLLKEGDGETAAAYFCLHELHKWPHEFLALPLREKAAVVAFLEERAKKEKAERDKLKRKRR